MSDGNLFNKLNQQRIPDEARALALAGQVDIDDVGIRIGPYTFPADILHVTELFNVLEGQSRESKKVIEEMRKEHLQKHVTLVKLRLDRLHYALHRRGQSLPIDDETTVLLKEFEESAQEMVQIAERGGMWKT